MSAERDLFIERDEPCGRCGRFACASFDDCISSLCVQRDALLEVARLALTGKTGNWYPKGLRSAAVKALAKIPAHFMRDGK